MKILMNHRFFRVVRALSIVAVMSGCAADSAMFDSSSEKGSSANADYPNALSCDSMIGGCFHGSMQCAELDIQKGNEHRSAVCLDSDFEHTIAGATTHAMCFERENMAGEPCQVCQTQAGETVYDDCMVDAEMRADSCEQDVEQLRDGMMYLCEICKDEDGTLISESCKPKDSVCETGVEQGPYVCEQCTLNDEIVFSECVLKSVDPFDGYVYGNEIWQCVDLYDADNGLLRHSCTGGDVDSEKETRRNYEEGVLASGENETGSDGEIDTQEEGGIDGAGSSDGVSDPVASTEDNCEDYFPDDNTQCTRCFDDEGTVISDVCIPVDRRANRCELLETESEICVFCINEIHELVEQTCEPRISEDSVGEPNCMTAKEGDTFCRLCGDDPMNPTEKVCMSAAPTLNCEYEEVYQDGQSGAKTCMVCTQSADAENVEVFRSCEGNAGGHEPAPPVCQSIELENQDCQMCRDPNYNIIIASTCPHAVVTQETHTMGAGDLECSISKTSSVLSEALCLRNHSCGGDYLTDEASNTYGMDPLCGASDVLTRVISTCDLREVTNMTPSLNSILVATAGELAQNIIAFYLMPVPSDSYNSEECLHFGLSAIVAANTVLDYQQLGWE